MIPEYSGKARQQAMTGSGKALIISTDDIKIFPCFAEHPPGADKMQSKARYFSEKGLLQSSIILDRENNLIDGYTSYLLARQQGIRLVPARYGKRQIVRARHKPGGKLYTWELPENLIDRVSAGDAVLVHTHKGVTVVMVAAVEEYQLQEHTGQIRPVIRKKGTGNGV
ncbi:MAG: hypothetical protein NC489_33660 [Ruminococcus flavefaciens]|nr:hypothetical protein [Ruminococcus flavefaciens]